MGAPRNEISAQPKSSTKKIITLGLFSCALTMLQKANNPIKNNLKVYLRWKVNKKYIFNTQEVTADANGKTQFNHRFTFRISYKVKGGKLPSRTTRFELVNADSDHVLATFRFDIDQY